jgi:putative tricarboxylic transport membrane protein
MVVAILGIVGYVLRKLEYDPAPLVLAFVVGPILERTLRQSLLISGGDPSIFLTRPVSRVLVIITVLFLISSGVWEFLRNRKRVASVET